MDRKQLKKEYARLIAESIKDNRHITTDHNR